MPPTGMTPIDWTQVIIALGTALIGVLSVWVSKKNANAAEQHAAVAKGHADRAQETADSIPPTLQP